MLKKISPLFILLFFLTTNAQFKQGKIYLKNGDVRTGLIKIRKFGDIKFKEDPSTKGDIYGYKDILGYDITAKGIVKYRYKIVDNVFPQIMKVVRLGKINLYSTMVANREIMTGVKVSTSFLYFMEKNGVTIKIGRKFNKNEMSFFEDCPSLIKKITKKEFKKDDVYKAVNFNNNDCS